MSEETTMNIQDLFNERIKQNQRIEELVNINEKLSLALESAENKLDKIKEKCLSIKGNPEHTIVSKNELVKQFLELLEEIE